MPLLGPESHLPQQLLAVLKYLPFLWSSIQTPLGGLPASLRLGTISPSSALTGFLVFSAGFHPTEKPAACSILQEMLFGGAWVASKAPEDLLRMKLKGGLSYLRAD